jgi:hypothetical protein
VPATPRRPPSGASLATDEAYDRGVVEASCCQASGRRPSRLSDSPTGSCSFGGAADAGPGPEAGSAGREAKLDRAMYADGRGSVGEPRVPPRVLGDTLPRW